MSEYTNITDPWLRIHYESGQQPMNDIRGVFRAGGWDLMPEADFTIDFDPEAWGTLAASYLRNFQSEQDGKRWVAFREACTRLGYRPAQVTFLAQEDTSEGFGEAPVSAGRAEARDRMAQAARMTVQWLSVGGSVSAPSLAGDVGMDLATVGDAIILPGEITYVPLGVKFAAPPGHWILLLGRSSLATKFGLGCVPGVIDNGFRGEMLAGLFVIGGVAVDLPGGTRVVQAILMPMSHTMPIEVEELPPSERGENGFGSTGH